MVTKEVNKFNKKLPYIQKKLLVEFLKVRNNNKKIIYTHSRRSTIIGEFIGYSFFVYNGKTFIKVLITDDMVGYKLGEFSPTRKRFSFKKQKSGTKN
jgi:small subunit ribosomal protein S19